MRTAFVCWAGGRQRFPHASQGQPLAANCGASRSRAAPASPGERRGALGVARGPRAGVGKLRRPDSGLEDIARMYSRPESAQRRPPAHPGPQRCARQPPPQATSTGPETGQISDARRPTPAPNPAPASRHHMGNVGRPRDGSDQRRPPAHHRPPTCARQPPPPHGPHGPGSKMDRLRPAGGPPPESMGPPAATSP
jgi:hypothetical protein